MTADEVRPMNGEPEKPPPVSRLTCDLHDDCVAREIEARSDGVVTPHQYDGERTWWGRRWPHVDAGWRIP